MFQYGDVLTIKQWHSLAYHIIKKVTTIGKEKYVQMMMTAYKRFILTQDYLHENIHRLQGIFKLFYGGFIQAVQALLGLKNVGPDPTKGSWMKHEGISEEMYFALQRIRIEQFTKKYQFTIECEDDPWKVQEQYERFCQSLENTNCMRTVVCVLSMKYIQCWLPYCDGVKIGNAIIPEVEGCNWISFWAALENINIFSRGNEERRVYT